jgi:hypothetical protein
VNQTETDDGHTLYVAPHTSVPSFTQRNGIASASARLLLTDSSSLNNQKLLTIRLSNCYGPKVLSASVKSRPCLQLNPTRPRPIPKLTLVDGGAWGSKLFLELRGAGKTNHIM